MANNTLLEKYYVFNKEKEMLAVYKMVDLAAKNDKLSMPLADLAYKLYLDAKEYDTKDCSAIAMIDGKKSPANY